MTALATPLTDRDRWLAQRLRGIGASESPIVLGLTGSRLKLWLRKQGALEPEPTDDRMQAGLDLEPYIVRMYERRTGKKIVEVQRYLEHPEMPWLLATLDAIREDGRVVELKTVGDYSPATRRLGDDGDSETLPDAWTVQVNQQMQLVRAHGISPGDDADVAVLGPTVHQFRVFPLRRSDELFGDVIAPAVREFWHEHVLAGVPPEDVVAADAETLARVYRARSGEWLDLADDAEILESARRYHELGRIAREADKQREAERARLLAAIGNADGATLADGWKVDRKVVETNYKAKEAYTGTSVRITVKEPK